MSTPLPERQSLRAAEFDLGGEWQLEEIELFLKRFVNRLSQTWRRCFWPAFRKVSRAQVQEIGHQSAESFTQGLLIRTATFWEWTKIALLANCMRLCKIIMSSCKIWTTHHLADTHTIPQDKQRKNRRKRSFQVSLKKKFKKEKMLCRFRECFLYLNGQSGISKHWWHRWSLWIRTVTERTGMRYYRRWDY